MTQVLGIVGSPRRGGNTHVLVATMLRGAMEAGAQPEVVFLGDLRVAECDGCHACWHTGQCATDDDMTCLYERLAAADALVLGTPVYWYGPTALLKGFLDRFVLFNCPENRPQVRDKPVALAIPFEETDPGAADLTVAMLQRSLAYLEMPLAGYVLAPGVTRKGEVAGQEDVLREAYELGRALADGNAAG